MEIYATLRSPLLRNIHPKKNRVFPSFYRGDVYIEDETLTAEPLAKGKVAAHMLLRLYDKQPKNTQNTIIQILAAWRKSTRTAPPTTSGPETVST